MTAVEASAPGKVVMTGEYAVLDEAPAIVMAVDRRARVSVAPAGGGTSTVRAPGFARGSRAFRATRAGIEWLDDDEGLATLEAAWTAVRPEPAGALDIVLDTSAFAAADDGPKLGIGSSAALTVALVAALDRAARAGVDVAGSAYAAHAALQGQSGSGVDVAAALSGGLLQYTMSGRRRRVLAWPASLRFGLYWSGTPADTVAGIGRYRERASGAVRTALGLAAESAAAAWAQADVTGILVETRRFTEELARIDTELELGIFAAGHGALAAAAPDGLVYKPCGAGGGDVGVALTTGNGLEAFSDTARGLGFQRLSLVLDPEGVAVAEVPA